ncbi:MAG TPA: hypothetical protein VJJ75_01820 [Candidatus Nanoarchaeia archaeon]|nr:hypothetical protein [Candidatus Nanoarchaeia archaeon]
MVLAKKEIKKFIALCIIAAAIAIGSTLAIYNFRYTTEEIPFDATAGDYIGINADTDMLHFGTGYPRSTLERELRFKADAWTEVRISSTLPFAYAGVPTFVLAPGEERFVKVFVSLPESKLGAYTGKFIIRQREVEQ